MSWFKRRTGCDRHIGMISRIENDVMLFLEEDKNYNIITCTTEKPSIKTIFTCDTEYVKYCETKERYFADIAIFDYDKMQDKSTLENAHQLSEGMVHVFVNGSQVLKDGAHTGET